MKRYVSFLLTLLLLAAKLQGQSERIGVDPRVELMGIIFRLAGNPEYTQGRIPAYNAAIDSHFAAFRDHEAIRLARQLRNKDGVSYDAVMNMAVHIKDVESLDERVPFDRSTTLESRWHGAKAPEFLKAARGFVHDADFAGFLQSQRQLFATTDTRLRAFVTENADLPWFDRFFGPHSHAPFIVAPVLTSGGGNYGAKIKLDIGVEEDYAFLCICRVDADGLPDFDSGFTSTLVHEFAHSYVHPLIDRFESQLRQPGNRLFAAVSADMRRQAYGNADTVLNESLVRAATARYAFEHDGPEAAARAVAQERRNSFLWTGELFELLGKYAQDREHYPTMESFMPRIVDCFRDAASHVDEMVQHRRRLGASVQSVPADTDGKKRSGALVNQVTPDSAADRAGIRIGDIITAVNEVLLPGPADLPARIDAAAESTVKLSILRNGQQQQVSANVEQGAR